MLYTLKVSFDDARTIEVMIEKDRIPELMESMNSREIFWSDEEENVGFFLEGRKVRFIQFMKVKDGPQEEKRNSESTVELPHDIEYVEAEAMPNSSSGTSGI